jgi:hypothetical protein
MSACLVIASYAANVVTVFLPSCGDTTQRQKRADIVNP